VLLLPAADPGERAAKLAAAFGRVAGQPVTVGASAHVADPERLPEAYAEAVRCTEAMLTLGRKGEGACMEQLGFIGVLLGESGTDAFVQRTVGPLLDYDAKRGTDLVGTLEAYYAAGGHLAKTKAALNVHVNTVSQRLDRVAQILGRDWNSPARSLEVQLALRVHRLSRPGR
ncbi:PucR family transcriptional regulator, partial [Glycomyces dulcitolivorans]|uniref:PucR family transcriptional regulator n=1 Tax=Glycomyces dulcitolivorans TaxID=2200759 RepID=UPI0018E51AF4